MTALPHAVIEAARVQAGMSFEELWIAYFALGGMAQPRHVRNYLDGSTAVVVEYDILALALNERFQARGEDHPVPYSDDLI